MKASTLRIALLLAIAGAVAFQLGRHRVSADLGVEETLCGTRFLSLSWSGLAPGMRCAFAGHVSWQPGLLTPHVLEVQHDTIDIDSNDTTTCLRTWRSSSP